MTQVHAELIKAFIIKYKLTDLKNVVVEIEYDFRQCPRKSTTLYLKDKVNLEIYLNNHMDVVNIIRCIRSIQAMFIEEKSSDEICNAVKSLYKNTFLICPISPKVAVSPYSAFFSINSSNAPYLNKFQPMSSNSYRHGEEEEFGTYLSYLIKCEQTKLNHNDRMNMHGQLLCMALNLNFIEAASYILQNLKPINLNINSSTNGKTPLYLASEMEELNLVMVLCDAKVDVNLPTDDTAENFAVMTPLAIATENIMHRILFTDKESSNFEEIIKILLIYRADPNFAENHHKSAMSILASSAHRKFNELNNQKKTKVKILAKALVDAGGNIDLMPEQHYKVIFRNILEFNPQIIQQNETRNNKRSIHII